MTDAILLSETFDFNDEVEFVWGTKKNPTRKITGRIINPTHMGRVYIKAETGRKLRLPVDKVTKKVMTKENLP